jgi:hypothetical protein
MTLKKYIFGKSKNVDFSVNTINNDVNSKIFTIRRESDNIEQDFSQSEINNGLYSTFIQGTFGAVKRWGILSNFDTTKQVRLIYDVNNYYVYDNLVDSNLNRVFNKLNMAGDWLFSVILQKEENGNSQRPNFGAKQDNLNNFGFAVQPLDATTGRLSMTIDRVETNNIADFYFDYDYTAFNLVTFHRKSGVFKCYLNNVEQNLISGGFSVFIGSQARENIIILGARVSNGAGKINKYKHVGVIIGGRASSENISNYNNALMTQYSI